MSPDPFDDPPLPSARADGCPRLDGRFGSLAAFWPLIEPVLTLLQPRRLCEIGVEQGGFTARLLAWGRKHHCAYVGIDPAPASVAAAWIRQETSAEDGTPANQLFTALSLEVLPDLECCGAYFLDGDHNYHTVRNELELIQRAVDEQAGGTAGPVIFAHDVGWPFGRRDMYHQPGAIPPEARHPSSDRLGASLEGDELIEGGFRQLGRYSIALQAGGPRNGVLTAIEDFLAADSGRGWQAIVLPAGYGLAILYRPADHALPEDCRRYLNDLRAAVGVTGKFLESCEANFLQLYLFAEHAKYHLDERARSIQLEQAAHHRTLEAYAALQAAYEGERGDHCRTVKAYDSLQGTYNETTAFNKALSRDYEQLQEAYSTLEKKFRNLLQHCDALQRYNDYLASLHTPSARHGADPSLPPDPATGDASAPEPAG